MTFLPIVERELRIAARLTATYRNRAVAAGVVMLTAVVLLLFGSFARSPWQAASNMFHTLSFLAVVFCVLEGVRKTADCLSEEKREGTLGLLFLTDLKGYDVILGKLSATSLNSLYGLMAILPVLALPILVGGVTPGEFWRMVLALVNILFFSLCAGMLVSAWCREESTAMAATFLVMLVFIFLPRFFGSPLIASFSPANAYHLAFASAYFGQSQNYWQSLGITQVLSWLMLIFASIAVPHSWQDRPSGTPRRRGRHQLRRRSIGDGIRRTEMLNSNPAFWLAMRDTKQRVFLWGLTAVTAVFALVCILAPKGIALPSFFAYVWLINFVLKMRVASQACHCLAEARRNNALEMLLSTPLTVNEIISGQIQALQRIFLAPVIAIIAIEMVGVTGGIVAESDGARSAPDLSLGMVFGMAYYTIFFLDLAAVTWAGMWFGLSAKKESQAITKTILLVLVAPFGSLFFCWFGLPVFIGVPIFWIAWASQKLRAEFRALATQGHAPQPSASGWIPGMPGQPIPPLPPVASPQ